MRRLLLDALPRGKKYKPLVSEFNRYAALACMPNEPHVEALVSKAFPAGSQIAHRRLLQWGSIRAEDLEVKAERLSKVSNDLREDHTVELVHVGIPRSPLDLLERAAQCGHPRGHAIHLPSEVCKVLEMNMEDKDFELAKIRVNFLFK